MEQQNHTAPSSKPQQPLSLHTLSSMRSLIINPSTSERAISSILETLTCCLQLTPPSLHNHNIILKLLIDLATHNASLSQLALDSIHDYTPGPAESRTRIATEITEAMVKISGQSLMLDDKLFAALCFNFTDVQGRLYFMRNAASRVWAKPALMFAVFIGFTQDPYPYVREASLEGLVRLSEHGDVSDISLVKGAYDHGAQLLSDLEDCVRVSAVRVVASWGQRLAASNAGTKTYWSNEVFAKLCSMARDMCMKVRVEVFNGLGKIEIVSEELFLQSLSKRVLVSGKKNDTSGLDTTEQQFVRSANSIAGAILHGLEDEFSEVRKAACESLRVLTILSVKFAREALDFLMDVLNDDLVEVRVLSLETMHNMTTNGYLKLQERHMHMFLGVLMDRSREVRDAGRKILKVVKLNDRQLFKSTIDGLLKNLDSYPQDEADVFSALSHLGRNHQKFTFLIMKEVVEEVDKAFVEDPEFNTPRIAALLVLSVSAPLSNGDIGSIQPIIFSYASTFLGRIHCAFSDVMVNEDALLGYLCEKSSSAGYTEMTIDLEEGQLPSVVEDPLDSAGNEMIIDLETQSHMEPNKVHNHVEQQQAGYNEVIFYINCILAKCLDIWPMIQSGRTNVVLGILSCWKEEFATMAFHSPGCADALAFTSLYLRTVKLLAEIWDLLPARRVDSGMGELELKLGKLEKRAIDLVSRFVGFSAEAELNVLELLLLTYALRLCRAEVCSRNFTFKRFTATYSRVETLLKESSCLQESTWPSSFMLELDKLLHGIRTSNNEAYSGPLPFDKCLKFFSLKQFVFRDTIKYARAEVNISNNDIEHPLPFVPGLRAGIPCDITLQNISYESRVWLRISMDDGITHHVYLDLSRFEVSRDERKLVLVAPYYCTPNANSFVLKVCLGIESLFENFTPVQMLGGPKRELVILCKEKLVYFSKANND